MLRKTRRGSGKDGVRTPVRKKAVKASDDLCRVLFEWGDDAIFLFDRMRRCLDVNPTGCRLLGLSRRKVRNRLLTEILLPFGGSDDSRLFQSLRRGQTKACRVRVCGNDGREVAADARAKGLAQGRTLVVLRERSVGLPIHEHRQESEQFLDSVLEHLPDMLFIKDATDLRFVRFNKAGEELLGYSREELLGKNDYDFFPKHEADFFTAKDREVLASGRMLDIAEEPIRTRAQGVRLLHTKKIPILSEDGKPRYLLGLSEDITEQYQLHVREAERRQGLKRLAELSLMLSGDPAEVFDQSVRVIGELFSVKVVCVSEIVGENLHFKSVYIDGQVFRDTGTCPLTVTPCATVKASNDLQVFDQVMERFPHASFLKDHRAVAYCGIPAVDHGGQVVAVTCLVDDRPHEFTVEDQYILRIFGQRIAEEFERKRDMAERKGIQDRLRASETRLETLLSSSPAVLYSCKATGDYGVTFVSDNVAKIFGYSSDEFIAESGFWAERIHPDDRERVFEELLRLFDCGTYAHEYRFLHKDGTYRWVLDEFEVVRDTEGKPIELIGCMSDITLRKRAELQALESESRFRHVVQNLPIGLVLVDESGAIIMVNREMEKLFGYGGEELIGQSIDRLLPSRFRSGHAASRQGFVRNPQTRQMGQGRELFAVRRDGSEFPVEIGLTIINLAQGVQVLASITDISERRKSEEVLCASEAKYRRIVETAIEGIWQIDEYGITTFVNRQMAEMLGYRVDEMMGRSLFDFMDEEARLTAKLAVERRRQGVAEQQEFRFQRKDGEPIWTRISTNPFMDEAGRYIGALALVSDITQSKADRERIEAAERQLRNVMDSLLVFVGVFSPDSIFLDANRAPFEAAGLQQKDAIGKRYRDTYWASDLPESSRMVEDAIARAAQGEVVRAEVPVRVAHDCVLIMDAFFNPIRDRKGRVSQVIASGIDITDRKRAEEVLRTNEERLRLALRASKQGLYDLDLTTGKAEVNDDYATMLGYDPAEFEETNARWVERLHPEDREKVYATYQSYLQGELPSYEIEFRQRTKAGDWKWILSIGSIVSRSEGGIPLRMLGTHLDISERKQAELAMKRQEALLDSFFSQSLDGCFFMMLDEPVEWNAAVDKDQVLEQIFARQRLTRVNDAMLVQYGGSREHFIGLTPNDLFAHNLSSGKEVWRSMLDRGRLAVQTVEKKLDGTRMWIEGEYVCLYDEQGRFIGHFGVQREITAQKLMENDLRINAARLSEAQHLARLGNWELDLRSNELVWSDEIFRIFEIDKMRMDASYKAFLEVVHPDDRAMVDDAYTNSVGERKPYSIVHRLMMPDGRIKYVHERGETDYDSSGCPIRSHGTVQDVTNRQLAKLQIEKSLREKEMLLREIHHRVKNNLQIISSLLYFQSKKIRDSEDLAVFSEGQNRLRSMILVHENLYRSDDLMHIEVGDYLRALTDGIRQSYMPMSMRVDLAIDIQPMGLPLEIAMPVGMIVNELLSNVYKYAFPDERRGVVRIGVIPMEGAFEIGVDDNGVGLPQGIDLERPMTFGLQLVHGLTSQLGGRLSCERNGGTSVRVHVPIPQQA